MTLQFSDSPTSDAAPPRVRLVRGYAPRSQLVEDAIEGLSRTPKTLPCKYLYDARGSDLFEQITQVREYYPTRTELEIMRAHVTEMADALGPDVRLVEFGSGSGEKTASLLAALERPAGCVLIDISETALRESVERLSERFVDVAFIGVCADYTESLDLPAPRRQPRHTAAYFPGSTIGNFSRAEAQSFLERVAELVGPGGGLLVGFDRVKDHDVLERAYDDAQGVTAEFNLNLLNQLREAGAELELDGFEHEARYNGTEDRIESSLVSRRAQSIVLDGQEFELTPGERIVTEHSHKFRPEDFAELAEGAGWEVRRHWSDARDYFSVCYLTVPVAAPLPH